MADSQAPDLGTSLTVSGHAVCALVLVGLSVWYLVLIVSTDHLDGSCLLLAVVGNISGGLLIFLASLRPGLIFSIGWCYESRVRMITPFVWERLADYQRIEF